MAERRVFLAELGTEELPPKALRELAEAFAEGVRNGLQEALLEPGAVELFATPRRLAVRVAAVLTQQPDRSVDRRGPPLPVAFDASGRPTRAAQAFADSCGVTVDALGRTETPKGSWLSYLATERGAPALTLLPQIVERALASLPIPKRMRWGSGAAEFARPVHWLVMLLGAEQVPARILDVDAGRCTHGHRFHAPDALELTRAEDYERLLETRGRVLASFGQRRARIESSVIAAAKTAGGEALIDAKLLDEVTSLTEWPVALVGGFDDSLLALPPEALIATLQAHQRYFPIRGPDGGLRPHFVAVANLESRQPELVRAGNERVVRARLADAAFFWERDRRRSLEARAAELAGVVFHARLGTLQDKARRVGELACAIARCTGGDEDRAARAARLAKTDLLTQMVGEFPELQGVMGRYYAQHDGEDPEVAQALEEQYLPRFAGDRLPVSACGRGLAVADRLDTIAGSFAIGARPTGNKDPFGLRRSALGALRIIIEGGLPLDLLELLELAVSLQPVTGGSPAEIYDFMMERLRAYYLEGAEDIEPDQFEAVLARRPTAPLDFDHRLRAVQQFTRLDASISLAAANKRIANILRQAGDPELPAADPALLGEPAERTLHAQIAQQRTRVQPLLAAGHYAEALERLASLRGAVDDFFDRVLVMADDPEVRTNRLALLAELRTLFLHTADLSRLQPRS